MNDIYIITPASRISVLKDLDERGLSDEQKALLKRLAKQFERMVKRDNRRRKAARK